MDVSLQLDAVARVPLNVTVLVLCAGPKCTPAIVTACPTIPDVGDRDAMLGGGGGTTTPPPPPHETISNTRAIAQNAVSGAGFWRLSEDRVASCPL
jgi:hypothetical protein